MMGGLFSHQSAEAACNVSLSGPINFGEVNPVEWKSSYKEATTTLTYSCTGLLELLTYKYVCIEIYPPLQGGGINPRTLFHTTLPSNQISFNLFKPTTGNSAVWGYQYGSNSSAHVINHGFVVIGVSSRAQGSVNIHGRLFTDNLMSKPVGSYAADMNVVVRMAFLSALVLNSCGISSDSVNLNVQANILKSCDVSATTASNLDFGRRPSTFSEPIYSTSEITTHCSNGTPYDIGLSEGMNYDGSTRRMKSDSGEYISYELYQDTARQTLWGLGSDVKKMTANGTPQSSVVYGRVPAQPTKDLQATTYKDTVTVTVTY